MTVHGHMFGLFPMLEPETALVAEWDVPENGQAKFAWASLIGTAASSGGQQGGSQTQSSGGMNFGHEEIGAFALQLINNPRIERETRAMLAMEENTRREALAAQKERAAMWGKVITTVLTLLLIAFVLYIIFR